MFGGNGKLKQLFIIPSRFFNVNWLCKLTFHGQKAKKAFIKSGRNNQK